MARLPWPFLDSGHYVRRGTGNFKVVHPEVKYVARYCMLLHKLIGCVSSCQRGGGGGGGNRSELLSLVEYYGHRSFGYMHIHMISRIAVLEQHKVVGYGYCWEYTLAAPALWQGRPWPHHSFIL